MWRNGVAMVGGRRLAWEQTGDGEPLLLIMGMANQCVLWPDPFCADLVARGFRVIRFDNRDIGGSDSVDRGVPVRIARDYARSRAGLPVRASYTLHDMTADTVGLMDALELRDAHLVGVSMGGLIGQILAARHPRRVRSLTNLMSHTNHRWHAVPRLRLLWSMSGRDRTDHSRDGVIRRNLKVCRMIGSPAYPRAEAELRDAFGRAFDRDYRPDGMLRQLHAMIATPCIDDLLPSITAPTQVVHGLADPLVTPINGRRCAALIRNARLELFAGMGHDFPPPLLPRWADLIARNAART